MITDKTGTLTLREDQSTLDLVNEKDYEVWARRPFTSDRKMMSAVVRRLSDNNFFIYVKGADSAVLPKIAPSSNEEMIDLEN